jgi:pre-mRNA-splicing factor 18
LHNYSLKYSSNLEKSQTFQDDKKKYFKRGDLIEKERQEFLEKHSHILNLKKISEIASDNSENSNPTTSRDTTAEIANLPRSEVIRKLRERCEPILLFGESEKDACYRLRQLEISAPEVNRGFRNDFQEAMEEVDQAYLKEILAEGQAPNKDKNANEDIDIDDSVTWESIQEMAENLGKNNREHDIKVIISLLKFLLKTWNDQLNQLKSAEKMRTKQKIARATFTQTRVYLKPLLRKLKHNTIPEDILDSLSDIVKHLLNGNYLHASDAYLTMAIGNAPWPIGVTMVGIHARTGREKIFSKNVAHVMNDETQRKYIQGLKRLMTKCQEFFPADPSRCVDYISKKDLAKDMARN